ncbi:MAG: hypothetical protein HY744_31920 [Deltaproteobacteria bacterium]|nr:hypothetical protein [Deltaproteobacteria bacterium]
MDRWTRLGVGVLALLAGFAACSGDDAGGGAASSGGPAGCDLANEPYCPAGDAQCIDGAWTCGGCDPHAIKDVACVDECGDPVPPGCLDRGWLCPEPGAGGCGGAGGAAGAGGGGAGCDP